MTDTSPARPRLGHRIGDTERQTCADQLAEAFMAGRLTHDEFEGRLDRSLSAVTDVDLALLTRDLDTPSQSNDLHVRPNVARDATLVAVTTSGVAKAVGFEVVLAVFALFAATWFGTSDWPLIAIFLWAFGSVAGAAGVYLSGSRQPRSPH
ncbi:DUF1707 SHOCT-like domain-containing protein [Microlunatus sagamiharensis]|uniref:DUF1707 SHOCT-like domain-containing protein n=1 Tax=Microlunatus sagamiharensis TaxID=546874 RepID=UPI0012FD5B1E|nr:DUF1707 domain-containing protein [Microlunatus sagamiharensis]